MEIREINNKNRVYNYYFDNLIKVKKLETKNIFIDEINYMNLVIIYTRHVGKKSIKMLSLHDHESIGKTEENEEKRFDGNDYMLDKIWDEIKDIIGIGKFDNTKKLIETNDKLPDDITLKNVVTLITCIIKDDGKLFPQIFLEEALYGK